MNDKVQVQTVGDTSAIVPGKPFMLGFKFTISPGWHIYWKNPGDSGLPTQVKLDLPEGFTAGELLFPVPSRLELPGDIVNYAYENQVMLMLRVTPPKDLPIGKSVTFCGKASWLVCQDTCVPGKVDFSLALPVAQTASAANEELFKQWTSQLPVKEDADDIASISHVTTCDNPNRAIQIKIDIDWKNLPSEAMFIPEPAANEKFDDLKLSTAGDSTEITLNAAGVMGHEGVKGLLVFQSPSVGRKGVEISMPGTPTRH